MVFESYDQECPHESLFIHRCKDCVPSGRLVEQRVEAELEASEGDDVSVSTSASASELGDAADADS